MAFEAIVKKQIERLKEPSLKCVDLVVNELANVVRSCAECVGRYPRLRDCIEQIVTGFMRAQEAYAKQQISQIVDFELAYMNTNHEDFIGFSKWVTQSPHKHNFALALKQRLREVSPRRKRLATK